MRDDIETALDLIITGGWANETTGHVDSPTGHVALIDLTTERDAMVDALDVDLDTLPAPAWYVVATDQLGFIHYAAHDTESSARFYYDRLDREYAGWDTDDNDFPTI